MPEQISLFCEKAGPFLAKPNDIEIQRITGLPVVEALAWGVACGAAAASLSGTEIGSRELDEQLLQDVKTQPCTQ